MKLTLCICVGVLAFASVALGNETGPVMTSANMLVRAPLKSVMTGDPTAKTLDQWLNDIMAYDLEKMQIQESVVQDSACGDAYFLDFTVSGFWNDVQAKVDFYVQTLTKADQDRLYDTIKANYATKGLPKCLLQDQFPTDELTVYTYHYDPDYTTVLLPVQEAAVPAGYPCAGNIERPLTRCWNVANPYGN